MSLECLCTGHIPARRRHYYGFALPLCVWVCERKGWTADVVCLSGWMLSKSLSVCVCVCELQGFTPTESTAAVFNRQARPLTLSSPLFACARTPPNRKNIIKELKSYLKTGRIWTDLLHGETAITWIKEDQSCSYKWFSWLKPFPGQLKLNQHKCNICCRLSLKIIAELCKNEGKSCLQ